jgi:hypothetical protein
MRINEIHFFVLCIEQQLEDNKCSNLIRVYRAQLILFSQYLLIVNKLDHSFYLQLFQMKLCSHNVHHLSTLFQHLKKDCTD